VHGGRIAPGDTLQGVTPDLKLIFVAEFRKNTTWEDGSGEETTAKKGSSLSDAITKKVVRFFFKKKYGDTHQLPPPGDTNPSDATGDTRIFNIGS